MEVLTQELGSIVVPLPGPTHPVALTPTSPPEATPPVSDSVAAVPVSKPQPAAPKQPVNPKDAEIKFQPVTREGMTAFFAAMRRPSTGQLSVASSKENITDTVMAETHTDSPENLAPILPDNQLGDPTLNHSPSSGKVDEVMEPTPENVDPQNVEGVEKKNEKAEEPTETVVGAGVMTPAVGPLVEVPKQSVEVVVPPVATPTAPSEALNPLPNTPVPPAVAPTPVAPVAPAEPVEEPQGETGSGRKAHKAQYMRFSRNVRGPNCPAPVKKKFLEAMADQDPVSSAKKIQDLFQEFRRCQEDWSTSQIFLEESRTSTTATRGIWKWMSRDETCMHIRYSISLSTLHFFL